MGGEVGPVDHAAGRGDGGREALSEIASIERVGAGKPVAKASGSSRCGAAPEPLYTAISRDSALYVSANMSPPTDVRWGMTTAHTAAAAAAASAALPPSRRAARPADVAR